MAEHELATNARGAGGVDDWSEGTPEGIVPLWAHRRDGSSRLLGFGSKRPERPWNELVELDLGRLIAVEGTIGGLRLA